MYLLDNNWLELKVDKKINAKKYLESLITDKRIFTKISSIF